MSIQDGLDHFRIDECFLARLESCPDKHSGSPQGEGSGKPSTVRDTSRRKHRCGMDQIDHRRCERQGGSRPTVAACFCALGHDHVGSNIERLASFSHVNYLNDQAGVRFADDRR